MKNSFLTYIKKYASEQPDSSALITSSKSITYSELHKNINSYSNYLKQTGVKEKTNIAILSENTIEFVFAIFALWKIGAVPVPINLRLNKNEIEEILNDCMPSFILVSKNFSYDYQNFKTIILDIDKDIPVETEITKTEQDENETAVIIYTSGTTGIAKGVMLTHLNLLEAAGVSVNYLIQNEKDRWLASLPFYHIGGFAIICRTIFAGSSLLMPASHKNDELIRAIDEFKPTLLSLVSTQLKRFVDENIKPNENLRHILLGGGPLSDELIIKAEKMGWRIIKVYGSTETTAFVTALDCKKDKDKLTSAGKVLPTCSIKIVNDNGITLPPNTEGEITISSKTIMKGYLNRQKETSEKIKNGFYYSGDYGFIDDDGYLYIQSRRTDLIISGGENINPIEIENYLSFHPAIKEICVIGIKDEVWGEVPAAILSLYKNTFITLDEVCDLLKEKVSTIKIPKKIFILKELPKTSLGKIKRDELKEKYY